MRNLLVILAILPFLAQAQSVGVKDIPASEDTTIEIKKGKKASDREFEIVTEEEDIEGDAAPLLKDARANWKKACSDWKKETRENQKDSQVLSVNCGKMECATVSMESTCQSKGKYKIKVQVK